MQDIIDEIVRNYFENTLYEIESVPFGLTNITKIMILNDEKYVIRNYNRHTKNVESIKFEAQVTTCLSKQNLSFVVPIFLYTNAREQFVRLSDGTLGAIVSFVEGAVPEIISIQQATEFGSIVGEVSSALSQCTIDCNYRGVPFTEFYSLHPLANYSAVSTFMKVPPFEISQAALNFYEEMISFVEQKKLVWMDLPKQLVHHDVLIYNLLSKENKIHGVLDFDFTSHDISFMEFTISLNHVIQLTNGSWDMAEAFIKGYSKFRKCTYQEINQLEILTRIYHIAVLHIYIGQHYSGKNIEQNFNYILSQFQSRNEWLNKHCSLIKKLIENYLI